MSIPGDLAQAPPEFLAALGSVRRARCRPELVLQEIPAPLRLAPFSVALGAEVPERGLVRKESVHGPVAAGLADFPGSELATGRFILLHNPAGSDVWDSNFRIVTYIRAHLEPDMGNDVLLGSVAWTWLVEALRGHDAGYRMAGGTATRILSESFGTLTDHGDTIDIELRASWTPADNQLASHLEAWSDTLCTFAGLPPLPDGVTSLPHRRRS